MGMLASRTDRYGFQSGYRGPRDSEPNILDVVPFGRSGFGLWTEHPVGVVIALGLLVMVCGGIPEATWFFAGVAILGGFCGFILWRHHSPSGTT